MEEFPKWVLRHSRDLESFMLPLKDEIIKENPE